MATNEPTKTSNRGLQTSSDVFGAMREEMDRLLQRFENGWPRFPLSLGREPSSAPSARPSLDVHDDGKTFTIEADLPDLPGLQDKDVNVTVADGVLTIKGERRSDREEKKADYYVAERSWGAFERSLRLPDTVDEGKLEASFADGVLRIIAPRKPEAVKSEKRIEIKKA